MEIDIIRKDFNYLMTLEKLLWKKYFKGIFKFLIVFAIVGVLFLLDAIDIYSKTDSFGGLTFSLALGFLMSSILILFYLLLSRHSALKNTKKAIASHKDENESVIIKITGWGIITKALDVSCEYSWSYFEGYKILDNNLLLTPRHSSLQNLFFERSEMSADKYDELVFFLNNKFLKTK